MPDPLRPTFRVVDPLQPRASRRRGPGVAVVAVSAYALLFLGALWVFKGQPRVQSSKPRVIPPLPSRISLLEGAGLAAAARAKYFERIATDRCDCGCDLTLQACLARDRSCVRSPELARQRLQSVAAAPASAAAP